MKKDWLWDRRLSIAKVKGILKDPDSPRFVEFVALLLSRKNIPKEIFSLYVTPLVFCKNWHRIKRQMRKDRWNDPRIEFWQQIYNVLLDKYKKEGMVIKEVKKSHADPFCKYIGNKIRKIRKQKALNQAELAKKTGMSQQIISRIEKGNENVSIITLKKIADALGVKIDLEVKNIED